MSQRSAFNAAASATALVSEPPRPSVEIRLSGAIPWKPATMATWPWASRSFRESGSMARILAIEPDSLNERLAQGRTPHQASTAETATPPPAKPARLREPGAATGPRPPPHARPRDRPPEYALGNAVFDDGGAFLGRSRRDRQIHPAGRGMVGPKRQVPPAAPIQPSATGLYPRRGGGPFPARREKLGAV